MKGKALPDHPGHRCTGSGLQLLPSNHSIIIRLGIGLIIAGAIGNLIDRIFLGEVIDFLDFMIGDFHWYVFNLADSYVTVGMSLVLFDSIVLEKKREKMHS